VPWYFVARYHVTMQRRMQELHNISTHDSLTGLFNRRDIMEVIKKGLEAHAGKIAMLLVDINNLTTINDASGHVAGDAVLARTSRQSA
jgi:diguanylate cyclase (GGDEF)-like protein